jgi:hypothetical protein
MSGGIRQARGTKKPILALTAPGLAMPHFHFDVCTNGVIVEDEDGLDLLNAATARLEAVRAAAEMMKDRCADMAERAEVSIAVRTQSLEPVCTVQVALRIR